MPKLRRLSGTEIKVNLVNILGEIYTIFEFTIGLYMRQSNEILFISNRNRKRT